MRSNQLVLVVCIVPSVGSTDVCPAGRDSCRNRRNLFKPMNTALYIATQTSWVDALVSVAGMITTTVIVIYTLKRTW